MTKTYCDDCGIELVRLNTPTHPLQVIRKVIGCENSDLCACCIINRVNELNPYKPKTNKKLTVPHSNLD